MPSSPLHSRAALTKLKPRRGQRGKTTIFQSRHRGPCTAPRGGPVEVQAALVREPHGGEGFWGLGWGWSTLTLPQHLCSLRCTSQRP